MPACGYKPGALSFWPAHSFQDLQVLQLLQSVHAPLPSCKVCKGLELSTACPSIALIDDQASLRPTLAFARGQRMFNLYSKPGILYPFYDLVAVASACLTCDVPACVFYVVCFSRLSMAESVTKPLSCKRCIMCIHVPLVSESVPCL